MKFGCVVLTMGRRPQDLRRALDSLLAQRGVERARERAIGALAAPQLRNPADHREVLQLAIEIGIVEERARPVVIAAGEHDLNVERFGQCAVLDRGGDRVEIAQRAAERGRVGRDRDQQHVDVPQQRAIGLRRFGADADGPLRA